MKKSGLSRLIFKEHLYTHIRPGQPSGLEGTGYPRRVIMKNAPVTLLQGLAVAHADGSESFFYICGDTLYAYNTVSLEKTMTTVTDEVEHGVADGDSVIIFTRSGAPRRFSRSAAGEWSETELFPDVAPYIIERKDMSLASVTVDGLMLKGSYDSRDHILSATDTDTLSRSVDDAYRRLVDSAAADGCLAQPVIARYRLYGRDGRAFYTSAPVMIAADAGVQATEAEVTITGNSVQSYSLSARLFKLELVPSVTADTLRDTYVSRAELLISPQIHPYLAGAPAVCRYKGADGGNPKYDLHIPGVSDILPLTADGSAVRTRALAILASIDTALRPAGSVTPGLSADLAALASLKPSDPAGYMKFTSRHSARNGDLILYGDITEMPFAGNSLPELSIRSAAASGGSPSAVKVTMADGSSVVRSVTSLRSTLSISPLLAYPDPEAVSMLIITESGRVEYPLEPSPCGRWAFRLAADCKPAEAPSGAGGFILPTASPGVKRMPDRVAVASADEPLRLLASTATGLGIVKALCAAPRSGVTWEFGKAGFYAMGTGGIAGVSPSARQRTLSSAIIDPRSVSSRSCVAPVPGSIAVVAGNELLRLEGSKVKTLLTPCRATAIGYSPIFSELWLSGGDADETRVLNLVNGHIYRRADISPIAFVNLSQMTIAVDAEGRFFNLDIEDDVTRAISFSAIAELKNGRWSHMDFSLPLSGRALAGSVDIYPLHSRDAAPVTGIHLNINGDVDHPAASRLLLPHCHLLRVEVNITTPYPKKFRYDPE